MFKANYRDVAYKRIRMKQIESDKRKKLCVGQASKAYNKIADSLINAQAFGGRILSCVS
jgi:hypothetical protein